MSETIKSFIALVIAILLIHMAYIGYIRPEAEKRIEISQQAGQSTPRDVVVLIKDYEQEICFILMIWGTFLILDKYRGILRNKYLYTVDLVDASPERAFDAEKALNRLKDLDTSHRKAPLIQILKGALWRYSVTRNIQDLSDAIESNVEALGIRQEAENAMIRYLIWAIPSIGFIGTVRGIGQALSMADQALAGNISGMTDSLGVAFNSTLVALLISIFLMFLFHQLQRLQDGQVVDTQAYCDEYLLGRIKK